MNKKILISLSVIGAVAAIAIGGTIAYFSDTETSPGNTFTAGTLDLKVDNECSYNGMYCVCDPRDPSDCNWNSCPEPPGPACKQGGPCSCTWLEKDLDGDVFFAFDDVKPGDWGEDTVSLHVIDNDAWACATLGPLTNNDNGCNDPESDVDETCGDPGPGDGELGDNLYFKIWADFDCENDFDEPDIMLTSGPANGEPLSGVTWTIADSTGNVFAQGAPVPLTGSVTYCLGVAWYVPTDVGNIIQSDSLTGDITFYAEQARNNPNFRCVQPIHVTSGPLYYGPTGWGGWSCPANTTVVDGSLVVSGGDLAQTFAWKPGATTGSVDYPNTPFGYTYGFGETGYIGQNDNDSGETIYLDFDCMPN